MHYILLMLVIISACTKTKTDKKEVNLQREEEFREDDIREKDNFKKSVPVEDQDLDL